jgi:Arc/MetJ family transcription regulator
VTGSVARPYGKHQDLGRREYFSLDVHTVYQVYTSMRTNIVIDDKLMREALRASGLKTKREVVEEGLRTLLRLRRQEETRRFRGKLAWKGDLEEMRTDR